MRATLALAPKDLDQVCTTGGRQPSRETLAEVLQLCGGEADVGAIDVEEDGDPDFPVSCRDEGICGYLLQIETHREARAILARLLVDRHLDGTIILGVDALAFKRADSRKRVSNRIDGDGLGICEHGVAPNLGNGAFGPVLVLFRPSLVRTTNGGLGIVPRHPEWPIVLD